MDTVDGIRLCEFCHLRTRFAVLTCAVKKFVAARGPRRDWINFSIQILKYTQVGVTCLRNLPMLMYSWNYWGEYTRFTFRVQGKKTGT